jgi:beta-galactosidase
MKTLSTALCLLLLTIACPCLAEPAAPLPSGVTAVWDLSKAWHEATPTRERVCINGLWRWQPATAAPEAVPTDGWGYFKVPGCWPGINDYMQKDSQTVYPNSAWGGGKLSGVTAAWYQRQIEVPGDWTGRRITLNVEYLNSYAAVHVDGKKAGEVRFPAGEVDLTGVVRPGEKHELSLYVVALPLKAVMLSYKDSAAAKEVKGTVERRGLCGDVYLVGTPSGARVEDVKVETSVRRGEVAFSAALAGLATDGQYTLRARVSESGRQVAEFTSPAFKAADLIDGRYAFSAKWKTTRLWDLNSPGNQFTAHVSLVGAERQVADQSFDSSFGFRELWIDGRDFILNGTRVFLSAVPLDNASIGASEANYAAACETMRRLKSFGINFVYMHNYDCLPGSHLSLDEVLRAADDVGMLVAVTQPHFSNYDWKDADADASNGYARDAAFYVRVAQNHPSVVFYSMSHNATGYDKDMDPDLLDGVSSPRDQWAVKNVNLALRAEAIVRKLDPSRIVYHHAGGNIGSMDTINFYPNFAPIQELSDWFGHWATVSVKPLFLCEYGAPFTWDWTMYRGWYNGKREFGSAAVPWEFCPAAWNAQFLGDRAYQIGEPEKADLRWEAKQFQAGNKWHRWDYPVEVGSRRFMDSHTVMAKYLVDNWRAYRTWGISGTSPWEFGYFWSLRDGVDRSRKELKVDWETLQRPGLSADYIDQPVDRMDVGYDVADWSPTADGKALLRNNQPVLAYIAGKSDAFTEKGHDFHPGESLEKQLIVINNSRAPLVFACNWSLGLPQPVSGQSQVTVETGQQARIPLKFDLPATLAPGTYDLHATARFGDGQEQTDTFAVLVLPMVPPLKAVGRIALFDPDPHSQTAELLEKSGVAFQRVGPDADLSGLDELIIGKLALTVDGPAPDLSRVRDGLKVVIFEQSSQALEKRLGFRVVEYGLRQVFERIPDHPILDGLAPENLRDWRGEGTTVPPSLNAEVRPQHGPTVLWCDIPVSHVWRCGTRGCVASVLIEKPARGDFRPILDGGYDLQYSPLMECRLGKGMMLFCQLDVTGRTEADPAAQTLVSNLLRYISTWKPGPARRAVYVGEAAGAKHLQSLGIDPAAYVGGDLSPEQVLVVAHGVSREHAPSKEEVAKFLAAGGHVLAVALDQQDADAVLPFKVTLAPAEHISAFFDAPGRESPLAGIGPADVLNRGPRVMPLLTAGAKFVGDGVLGYASGDSGETRVVFCQLAPWQIDVRGEPNLKRTYRRTSYLLTRLLANLGVVGEVPVADRVHIPVKAGGLERRWLDGLYLDTPEEWDYPYRFFRW